MYAHLFLPPYIYQKYFIIITLQTLKIISAVRLSSIFNFFSRCIFSLGGPAVTGLFLATDIERERYFVGRIEMRRPGERCELTLWTIVNLSSYVYRRDTYTFRFLPLQRVNEGVRINRL